MDCLDPPIQEIPEEAWFCPPCAPSLVPPAPEVSPAHSMEPEIQIDPALQMEIDPELQPPEDTHHSPVASSSKTIAVDAEPSKRELESARARTKKDRKGKGRAVSEDDSDVDVELDDDVTHSVLAREARPRHGHSRRKSTGPREMSSRAQHPPKRIRITLPTSQSPPSRPQKVFLRLNKGKGRARDSGPETDGEDDESPRGLFDEILNEEDRDTSKQSILNSDKERFEKSRQEAEVCHNTLCLLQFI